MVTEKMIEAAKLFDDMSPEESIGAFGGSGQWVELCTVRDLRKLEDALSTDAEPVAWYWEDATGCFHITLDRPDVKQMAAIVGCKPKPLYAAPPAPSVAVKLEKLPVAFEVLDTENGTYLTRSEQAAIKSEYEYNGLYRRDGCALSAQVQDVAVDAADIGRCLLKLSTENPVKWAEAEKKPILRGWFVGQVMKHFDGKPDEQLVRELVDTVFAVYPAAPAAKLEEKP